MFVNRGIRHDRLDKEGLQIEDIINSGPEIGDRVIARVILDKHTMHLEGTVVEEYPFFFNVRIDTERHGSYIISINKVDVMTSLNITDVRIA